MLIHAWRSSMQRSWWCRQIWQINHSTAPNLWQIKDCGAQLWLEKPRGSIWGGSKRESDGIWTSKSPQDERVTAGCPPQGRGHSALLPFVMTAFGCCVGRFSTRPDLEITALVTQWSRSPVVAVMTHCTQLDYSLSTLLTFLAGSEWTFFEDHLTLSDQYWTSNASFD